jgi:hypothetical protein
MIDAITELKVRAEILQGRSAAGTKLRDCLTVVAKQFGFQNWPLAKNVLTGEGEIEDFGTLLCPPVLGGGHINRWYARYEEAAEAREGCKGYLLAYRRQFLVVDRYYIESMKLDPGDPDWEAIGYDWARPKSVAARTRLYGKVIGARIAPTGV